MRKSRALSEKQKKVRDFLWDFIAETGHSPRPEAITEKTGVKDTGYVLRLLEMKRLVVLRTVAACRVNAHGELPGGTGLAAIGVTYDGDEIWVRNPDNPFSDGRVSRRCLCCRSFFMSAHKFNRLCPSCHEGAGTSGGTFDDCGLGYVSNVAGIVFGRMGGFHSRWTP